MTTEGWPNEGLTSSDVPSLVRHHAGTVEDPDRYELLGEAEGADEAWHVLDHRAATGEALFTLAALRPTAVEDLEVLHADEHGEPVAPDVLWRERAAGLARVKHARLAGVVATFSGPAPHLPGKADVDGRAWSYAVLEQAAGRSVADWLRDDPGAGVEERFTVLATAASVLQELHRGSEDAPPLVHGDITPRSVRLGGFWPADGVRLAGASLGGLRHGPVQQRAASVYTAPEVRAGALPSAASDVFGFGATAVFLLTGTPPAMNPEGDVEPSLVRRQLSAASLTAPHPGLADLLLQALSADPAQRPDRLPAWVNGMRAFVEPRPSLDPYDGFDPGPATVAFRPEPHRATRSLPKRPVVVIVGALLLATAGTAVAIAAVQQGRLRDVPNPVAIVQPPQTSEALPTSSLPEATAEPGVPSTGEGETGGSAAAPSTRRPSASSTAIPSTTSPSSTVSTDPAAPAPGQENLLPGTAQPPALDPGVPPVAPPAVPVPTTSVIPPTTSGPDVSIPPVVRPPVGEPTSEEPTPPVTGTPTETESPTPTETDTDTDPPVGTASPSSTRTAPEMTIPPFDRSQPTVVGEPTAP